MLQRLILLAAVLALGACSQPGDLDASAPASPAPAPYPAADAVEALPQQFIAFGNEPFWNVRVDGDALHWSSPENMEGIGFSASPEVLPGQRRYSGQLQGQAVSLTISAGPCSDGMSDQIHPWQVSWTIDGRQLQGCARALD